MSGGQSLSIGVPHAYVPPEGPACHDVFSTPSDDNQHPSQSHLDLVVQQFNELNNPSVSGFGGNVGSNRPTFQIKEMSMPPLIPIVTTVESLNKVITGNHV